jgi:serine protein kinase
MSILNAYKKQFEEAKTEVLTIEQYLNFCKEDSSVYSSPHERLLKAIGEPEIIDTSTDPKLRQIFSSKIIKRYPAFKEFYGMEEAIEKLVSYFVHAAQGLEEKKQVLYLLGPVGGGKSSLAEKIKELMQAEFVYILADENGNPSPCNESPLGLFNKSQVEDLESEFGIPARYIKGIRSPWATKRLKEYDGDITKFKIIKRKPSVLEQVCVSKTEPGDDNNQDTSALIGKTDLTKLAEFPQSDTDSYSYSGALSFGNQGVVEFVEMFKAPIKVLHPLLTATQEGNYNGAENGINCIPFDGFVLAHSNESEWDSFKNNKNNEAFLDRIYIVKVPYSLRYEEEVNIYKKSLKTSQLFDAPCAKGTLDILAKFTVLSRLKEYPNSSMYTKMKIYNGESLKDKDVKAKSITDYKEHAGIDEGMEGISTRTGFKILAQVFNFDSVEVAANPVHMFYVIEDFINLNFVDKVKDYHLNNLKLISEEYFELLQKEIQDAYLENQEYGQNVFDNYIKFADFWIQNEDYKDPETGQIFDREVLNAELEKTEKPSGIANPKDFRHEVVNFNLRYRANHEGKNVPWKEYEKMKDVIGKRIFSNINELLPIISFGTKTSKENEQKHDDFVSRMKEKGYTERQVKLLVEWFIRLNKSQ